MIDVGMIPADDLDLFHLIRDDRGRREHYPYSLKLTGFLTRGCPQSLLKENVGADNDVLAARRICGHARIDAGGMEGPARNRTIGD